MPFQRAREDSVPFSPTSADTPMDNQPPPTSIDTSFSFADTPMEEAPPFSPITESQPAVATDRTSFFHHQAAESTAPNPALPALQPDSFSISSRRAAKNDAFRSKLKQMALPLAPLVQLTTGQVHPRFPGTLLNFWLLTDAELESLSHFYHQRTPSRWTLQYPCPVSWGSELPLEEKRRKIGKFIGLRGCESPVTPAISEEELMREARRARAADEDEVWRRKLPWC